MTTETFLGGSWTACLILSGAGLECLVLPTKQMLDSRPGTGWIKMDGDALIQLPDLSLLNESCVSYSLFVFEYCCRHSHFSTNPLPMQWTD